MLLIMVLIDFILIVFGRTAALFWTANAILDRCAPPETNYDSSLFTLDLRSSLLTLGIVEASFTLLSLNRSLHSSLSKVS